MKKTSILMILDGFGLNDSKNGNAISLANTPNLDNLFKRYPNSKLSASGLDVGLPPGQMGNSEVGHLNIGAGRIVYQELTRITKAIETGDFFNNSALLDAIENAKKHGTSIHLMGLLSDGGVHSHNFHLYALLKLLKHHNFKDVYIHAFLDGRDVPPTSAGDYLEELESVLKEIGVGQLATISGRYYAMDRDQRWDRVQKTYEAMTMGIGIKSNSSIDALGDSYSKNIVDEFLEPTVILQDDSSFATVGPNDSVIMFNFRPDRARELTRAFVDPEFEGFERKLGYFPVHFVCMTQYDVTMPNVDTAFKPYPLKNTLGEYLSLQGYNQLRIAETEKYAHVTFFFNGGVEVPNENETRILIPSPKVPTYDLKPEMSIYQVTENLINEMEKQTHDVIIVNFANADMVGHTGSINAAIQAVEAVDKCVGKVVDTAIKLDAQILLTADHGNADEMLDAMGNPITAHSTNPVPLILINADESYCLSNGCLSDIAPTLLEVMELEQPEEMTGNSLLVRTLATAEESI